MKRTPNFLGKTPVGEKSLAVSVKKPRTIAVVIKKRKYGQSKRG